MELWKYLSNILIAQQNDKNIMKTSGDKPNIELDIYVTAM